MTSDRCRVPVEMSYGNWQKKMTEGRERAISKSEAWLILKGTGMLELIGSRIFE